ncbi:MAG: glycosyltransferase [Lutibacter sp.]|nr:glycosyltransferase [Lutibacter sp.]
MIILIVISFIYVGLISSFIYGFNKLNVTKYENTIPKNSFSIVIPFRNEVHNLPSLLQSLNQLDYPKKLYEIILINDESTDNFKPIINNFKKQNPNIKVLNSERLTVSPKKDAINTAITFANFDWIVTTDADCKVSKKRLQLFNQFIEKNNPLFISAPVKFELENSFLHHFQNLNFLSLIGSTIGSFGINKPFMCNGANLCYHKDTFNDLKGSEGNSELASGDDIFLLEKFKTKYPTKVLFLKSEEAIVSTNSEESWMLFFNQQIRWASKTTSYSNGFSKIVALIIFIENLSLFSFAIFSIFVQYFWGYFILLFVLKIVVDFMLISKTAIFLKNVTSLNYYLIICFLHPFYIVFTALFSLFKNYKWKGRKFSK